MILVIEKKDNSKMYERARSVDTDDINLTYFRDNHYPGEENKISIDEICNAYILTNGKILCIL